MLPLSVIVTREGRVLGVSVLSNDHDGRDIDDVLDAISRARLQPAQGGGGPWPSASCGCSRTRRSRAR